jgi:predicted O-linked N-acetylglucosamine transferase (SPINDLY family)
MHLFVRTLELSRREMFDQQAFSFGPHSKGPMRQRVVQAVSKFHDVRNMGDKEVAQLAQAEGIDIAVDLTGYTRNSRCGIFSYRAAPIQVNYLGYPGTSGAAWMDYIIADPVIIPKEMAQHYSEKVIYLPNSYMPSDNTREIAARPLSRTEEGLPEKGFVFCCFNKPSKIRPQEFNIWMRLLRQVDHSVLWLKIGNDKAKENLRQEATKHGIDPSRLVFASYVDELADHLARHRLADLFLDTFNHNAHTTANDALWAGLPIITKLGAGFASRVTSSLLKAANLPELITHSSEEYEELALELARNSAKLSALRSKLEANLVNTPLFDSEGFSRDLESAYELVYDRYLRGDQPGVIHV